MQHVRTDLTDHLDVLNGTAATAAERAFLKHNRTSWILSLKIYSPFVLIQY